MSKNEKITTWVIWLIVSLTTIFYLKNYYHLKSIEDIVVSLIPSLVFFSGGVLIFNRDRDKILKSKSKEESYKTIELTWVQALKHDLIIYSIPIIILALPLFFGKLPTLADVFQACFTFLALSYIKFLYWGEL